MKLTSAVVFLASGLAVEVFAQDRAELRDKVRPATVFLEVTFVDPDNPDNECHIKEQGTGFIVTPAGGVITALHLLDGKIVINGVNESCPEAFVQNPKIKGRIGYLGASPKDLALTGSSDKASDVAALRFGDAPDDYPFLEACLIDQPEDGADLMAFGFALSQDFTDLDVKFQGITTYDSRWRLSSQLTGGMSGGPITDLEGRVVGLVKGGLGANAVQTATPLTWATSMLDRVGAFDVPACTSNSVQASAQSGDVYDVDIIATVSAPQRKQFSKSFSYNFHNEGSCEEEWVDYKLEACLPEGAEILKIDVPKIHDQQHDGRTWLGGDWSGASCVDLWFGYSDRGLDIQGNCRGHGLIDAEWRLTGVKNGTERTRESRFSERLRRPTRSRQEFRFPVEGHLLEGLNGQAAVWKYDIEVRDTSGAIVSKLSNAHPSSSIFQTHQDRDGTVFLTISP